MWGHEFPSFTCLKYLYKVSFSSLEADLSCLASSAAVSNLSAKDMIVFRRCWENPLEEKRPQEKEVESSFFF